MLLLYAIVARAFNDRLIAASAVVAFSLFTYSLEFSVELWPHMLSVALVLISFYLTLRLNKTYYHFFLAGLISASAIGVRYQNIIFTLLIAGYVLSKHGLKKSLCLLAGLLIPLLAIFSINYSIFGSLTTGYSELGLFFGGYNYFYLAFLVVALSLLYLAYPKLNSMFNRRLAIISCALAFIFVLIVFQANDSGWLGKVKTSLQVMYSEVFDIGAFPSVVVNPGKKSLLQSTPFLILALFAIPKLLKSKSNRDVFVLFTAFSMAEVVFFSSAVRQHGEYTSNMRFFLESVPFLAALSVYAMGDFLKNANGSRLKVYIAVFATMLLFFIIANKDTLVFAFYRIFPMALVTSLVIFHLLQS
jgi:MFS family permease